jgi:hypothetical protein
MHVVSSLCAEDDKQRINSADYLLPTMIDFDPLSSLFLIDMIRSLPESVKVEHKLWGIVNIVLQCRLKAIDIARHVPGQACLF